jgi:ribonucleoside-diphosphate reductase alpha chain
VYYTDEDFFKVQSWVYDNFDIVGGLSFFPYDDYIYDKETQPYLPITKEEYEVALQEFPSDISWDMTGREDDDNTTGSQEMACSGGSCEI